MKRTTRHRHRWAGLASGLVLAIVASPVAASPALNGEWVLDMLPGTKLKVTDLPLTAAAQVDAGNAAKRAASGKLIGEGHVKCLPDGMPHLMAAPFGIEFLETKGRITILAEVSSLPRTIYTDGRPHPADGDPSWNGHSIGHWEKDVLVVDTVGFNDRVANLFNGAAQVHRTAGLHVVERIHLVDKGAFMLDEMTLDDPATFTMPFKLTYRYRRLPAESEVMESICEVDPALLAAFEVETAAGKKP